MQHHIISRPFAVALLSGMSLVCLGADKSYMTLVGELIGIVEAPRYLRDACVRRVPQMTPALRDAYSAWRKRHAALIANFSTEVARAEGRATRERSPFAVRDFSRAGAQLMQEKLAGVTRAQAREVCGQYEDFLRDMDGTMRDTVPARLAAIRQADRALSRDDPRP